MSVYLVGLYALLNVSACVTLRVRRHTLSVLPTLTSNPASLALEVRSVCVVGGPAARAARVNQARDRRRRRE